MTFTFNDIVKQFDPATFSRGEHYARTGKVLNVRQTTSLVEGEVDGSGREVYQQKIRFKIKEQGLDIDGRCTCPVSRNCKHVVATLLVGLQQTEAALNGGLPALANQWADDATRQVAHALAIAAPSTRAGYQQRLLFVLVPDPDDHLPRLQMCYARLRKDGSIVSVAGPKNSYEVLHAPGNRPSARDEEAIRLYVAANLYSSHSTPMPLSGPIGASLLDKLSSDGRLHYALTRVELNQANMVTLRQGPPRQATLGWHASEDESALMRLQWRFDDGGTVTHVFATEPPYYLAGDVLGELLLAPTAPALPLASLLPMVAQAPPLRPEQRGPMTERMLEAGLERVLPLPQREQIDARDDITPVPHLLLASLETSHVVGTVANHWHSAPVRHDYAALSFDYDGMVVKPSGTAYVRRVSGDSIELIARDFDAESDAIALLEDMGFMAPFSHPALDQIDGGMQMAAPRNWELFASQGLPLLQEAGWQIEIGESFYYQQLDVEEWYADLPQDNDSSNEWFKLELGIVVDGERYALLPLLLDYLRGLSNRAAFGGGEDGAPGQDLVVVLPDGRRVLLPWPRIQPLLAILHEMHFRQESGKLVRLPFTSAARLAELEAAAQLRWMGGERVRALARKLHDFTGIAAAPLPAGLQAQLRPYQHAGLSWLQFLREFNFNGILADDMGLGKTVQTLAHILLEKEAGRLDRPALVVAPTSLMSNWQSEAARFTPGLRVLLLHGKDRTARFDEIAAADLVLTTYALLGRDEQALRAHRYHLLILDEAQYIKNSRAKAAQTACLLEARHRLCLTGTPVQNHLGELWSLFHFLMPGLLGTLKTFNATMRRPIELHGDAGCQATLNARVKPFMLRRTKDKVATELPPKTTIELPVEFDSSQRDLYETVRVAMDKKVKEEIDRRGLARSHIVILDALLKLRQVCCDPRLLKKPASSAGSAKLDTLLELLDTLLSENRKVLVFSQFTSMLALIGDALQARAIDYALLTGDTVDRAAAIAAFQDGQVKVFLISLKAGGVGLNLTAADTVIHYDPWWNPASENQATDRAWRIGQTQPVFVYKLIAQGTVEEKIQAMQKRKGELATAVLDAEGGLAGGIEAADLQAILAR